MRAPTWFADHCMEAPPGPGPPVRDAGTIREMAKRPLSRVAGAEAGCSGIQIGASVITLGCYAVGPGCARIGPPICIGRQLGRRRGAARQHRPHPSASKQLSAAYRNHYCVSIRLFPGMQHARQRSGRLTSLHVNTHGLRDALGFSKHAKLHEPRSSIASQDPSAVLSTTASSSLAHDSHPGRTSQRPTCALACSCMGRRV